MGKKGKLAEQVLEVMERAFHAGHELAFLDAIEFCYQTKRILPEWAFSELAHRSRQQATGKYKPKKKMGPHSKPWDEQEQIVKDAECYAVVNDWREAPLRERQDFLKAEAGVKHYTFRPTFDAFAAAGKKLHLSREGAIKAYYRHDKRRKTGSYYVSLLYVLPDVVAYFTCNEELLN